MLAALGPLYWLLLDHDLGTPHRASSALNLRRPPFWKSPQRGSLPVYSATSFVISSGTPTMTANSNEGLDLTLQKKDMGVIRSTAPR